MTYVLILITVFSASSGLHSSTAFQEFNSLEACQQAAEGIRREVKQVSQRSPGIGGIGDHDRAVGRGDVWLHGGLSDLGREVIAQCHALGKPSGAGR